MESHLEQRVAEIEAKLARAGDPTPTTELSNEGLAAIAHRIYQARSRRARYWCPDLLGEPAWDILLDLFVAAVRGVTVRTSSACLASRSPLTTGLRWIGELEKHGLLERYAEFGDCRVKLVRLSRQGFQSMRSYLLAGLAAGELSAGSLT